MLDKNDTLGKLIEDLKGENKTLVFLLFHRRPSLGSFSQGEENVQVGGSSSATKGSLKWEALQLVETVG